MRYLPHNDAERQAMLKTIGVADIEAIISKIARIPPKTVSASDKDSLRTLERDLKMVVYGQDEAIDTLAGAIKMSRSGLGNEQKPIGSFLFLGPTGVGKTELCKALAAFLFDTEDLAAKIQARGVPVDKEAIQGLIDRLNAGLETLKRQETVDPGHTAAVGYCFGGAGVLELARSGADLAGVVSFHGNLDTPLPVQPGVLKAKILVCHGAVDPYVKPEAVQGFVDEMEQAGADYQLIMYAGAVHAFTQRGAGDDPSRGAAYNAAADRRSWRAMQDFFAEIF